MNIMVDEFLECFCDEALSLVYDVKFISVSKFHNPLLFIDAAESKMERIFRESYER